MDGIEETEAMDDIAVNEIHASAADCADGADIVFAFNGTPISVSIFPANGSSAKDSRHLGRGDRPLQDRLIDLLSRAVMCDDDDEFNELEDEVLGVILDAGRHLFPPPTTPSTETGTAAGEHPNLQDLLFPEIRCFLLKATGDNVSIIPASPSEAYTLLTLDPEVDLADP